MQLSEIEYSSYLSYTPRPKTGSDTQIHSKNITIMLKNDATWQKTSQTISDYMIQRMSEEIDKLPFVDFFKNKPLLVPIPRSSMMKTDSLWVPQRIATSLVSRGLGSKSVACLKRIKPVPKSSSSSPENRPKAKVHYDSFSVETLSEPDEIILIDDVVTRGATIMGAANRIVDAFPNAKIRAFALIRTVSDTENFTNTRDPCVDVIKLALNGETYRSPDSVVNI